MVLSVIQYRIKMIGGAVLMDVEVLEAITAGFTTMKTMIVDIIKLGVPASIAVMALAGGARYAMRWIRGLISKA